MGARSNQCAVDLVVKAVCPVKNGGHRVRLAALSGQSGGEFALTDRAGGFHLRFCIRPRLCVGAKSGYEFLGRCISDIHGIIRSRAQGCRG